MEFDQGNPRVRNSFISLHVVGFKYDVYIGDTDVEIVREYDVLTTTYFVSSIDFQKRKLPSE
eukprot:scaffold1872_cov262-Amphora_coffeaeformis.AAC.3